VLVCWYRGHSFFSTNAELLERYAACATAAEVIEAQNAWLEEVTAAGPEWPSSSSEEEEGTEESEEVEEETEAGRQVGVAEQEEEAAAQSEDTQHEEQPAAAAASSSVSQQQQDGEQQGQQQQQRCAQADVGMQLAGLAVQEPPPTLTAAAVQ
jgi:pre-rRNA-processing protein TSR3